MRCADFPYLAMRTADGGPTTFENADLKLVSGSALWAPPFSSMTSERIWSGRINYSALTARCKALESELESARAEADAARERIVVLRAEVQRARGVLRSAKGSGTPAEVRRAKVRPRRARKALEGARMNLRSRMETIDQIRSDLNQGCRD